MRTVSGQLSYVYAVVRSSAEAARGALAGLPGVAGAPLTLVRAGPVAAVVGAVPGEEFSEPALKARLEDLDWLEATARAHHHVVDALAARTTVLPLRLATVYRDEARVEEMLGDRAEVFTALLDRLEGHVEWGVKVYAEPLCAAAPPPGPGGGSADEPGSGRAYLQRRRQQHRTREDIWRAAEDAVRRTEEAARGLAVDRARHRPQQGDLVEGPGQNVANDAYLVPHRLAEEFRARMLHAADDLPGVRVEVTGPWAPYSFTELREGVPQR